MAASHHQNHQLLPSSEAEISSLNLEVFESPRERHPEEICISNPITYAMNIIRSLPLVASEVFVHMMGFQHPEVEMDSQMKTMHLPHKTRNLFPSPEAGIWLTFQPLQDQIPNRSFPSSQGLV